MKNRIISIAAFIGFCIVGATISDYRREQRERAQIEAQQTEQARQQTAVLQIMNNASQFMAQQQAAEARAKAERTARQQEIADGVAAGIHQADRQAIGLPPR